MASYRIARTGKANAQAPPDPLQPADPLFSTLFRADAAGPQPQEAPPVANDDSYTTSDAATITGNLLTNDTPGDVPLAITAVNGSALAVDREIILASGARLRVNADGSFTYNPNGAFNSLPTTNEVFTYTVAGGDTATVTITIEDPPNPNIGTDDPETINGTPGDDIMDGRGGDDIVNGLGGNDSIDGGTGADQLNGSTGNDTYFVDNAGDTVTELDGEGYDIIVASVNYTLGAGVYVEELIAPVGRVAAIELTGNGLDNIIRGASGGDTLRGEAGNDLLDRGTVAEGGLNTMIGGTGDDTYLAGALGGVSDSITELDGEGYDIVYLIRNDAFVLSAGAYVELIAPVPMFIGAVNISGNELNNEIRGGQQNDQLNGKGGADTLIGFAGNDTYTIDQLGDVIVEQANAGTDTVRTSINYTLAEGSNLENLTGGLNPDGTPSNASFSLGGNSANNVITGGGGTDIIVGGGGNDTLLGLGGNDSMYGEAGNDSLDGGTGADLMDGGTGNDTYFVDNAGDVVIDAFEAGQTPAAGDTVLTSVSFGLTEAQHIEVLDAVTGSSPINLTGNSFVQAIYGNSGDNVINGGGGADHLEAGGGDDTYYIVSGNETIAEFMFLGRDVVYAGVSYTLAAHISIEVLSAAALGATDPINLGGNELAQAIYGNAGANIIAGLGGADYLAGLGGDDTYFIQSGSEIVVEALNGGRDVVYTAISYVLANGTHVEVLAADSILATTAINLAGNSFNNEIYGNNGNNMLFGGGGAGDYLVGWGGNDTYFIQSGGEIIVEFLNGGRDVVYTAIGYTLAAGAHVEVLAADSIAATTAIDLTGNELGNEVYGNNGANTLNGGAGSDYLAGWGGADNFAFTTALGSGNVDILSDFSVADDTILLDNAVFAGLVDGALPASAFVTGAAAGDIDDRIIYNSATGQIFFDADGSGAGAQVHFATVNAGTILTAGDFTVI